ncbi:MAG: phasin family protein [Betaproteobacteria bacterium]|nr:phasin family protein [Betaproteobacteria bacterium]
MTAKPEQQFNEIQKKSLEAAVQLAQLSIENTQRVIEVQVAVAKSLFEDSVNNAKALSGIRNPQEAVQLRTRFAQNSAEKVFAGAREITEIATKAQAQISKLVGEQITSNSTEILGTIQQMFQGLPIADEGTISAIQNTLNTTRTAVDRLTRASSEAFQAFSQAKVSATTGKSRAVK